MSDYRINFDGEINGKDADNLARMLDIIDDEDKLTIIVDNNNAYDAEFILRVLRENEFECKTSVGEVNNRYYISAIKTNKKDYVGIH